MHSLLKFAVLLISLDFSSALPSRDDFGRNAGLGVERRNRKFRLPWPKVDFSMTKVEIASGIVELPVAEIDLYGGKLDLTMAKVDLVRGKIDLTNAKVDLSGGRDATSKANEDLSGCKSALPVDYVDSSGRNTELKILKPLAFSSCFTVTLTSNGKQGDRLSHKYNFAIEIGGGASRLIMHNYKEVFGESFSWVDKPTECCVSWLSSTNEFHLYLEGKHVLGGTGRLTSGLADKVEDVVVEEQTLEAVSGLITELKQWNRALSKDEVREVASGSLKSDSIEGKSPNWKITAVQITEPFQLPQTPPVKLQTEDDPAIISIPQGETIEDMVTEEETTTQTTSEATTTAPGGCPHPVSSKWDYESDHLNRSYAKRINVSESVRLHEMTVCGWIFNNDTIGIELEPIISLAYFTNGGLPGLVIRFSSSKVACFVNFKPIAVLDRGPRGEWHHACLTWGADSNGTGGLYVDGKPIYHVEDLGTADYFGGIVYIQQISTPPYNPKHPTEGFILKSTGVHFWDYVLTKEQVLQHYRCGSSFPGNIIDWDKTEYAVEPGQ